MGTKAPKPAQHSAHCEITAITFDDFSRATTEVFKAQVFSTVDLGLILSVTAEPTGLTLRSSTNSFHILPPFWLQLAPVVMHQVVNITALS